VSFHLNGDCKHHGVQRAGSTRTAQTPVSSGVDVTALAVSVGPGRDQDTNVRERDGSRTKTGGTGTGAGELLVGTGGSGMA